MVYLRETVIIVTTGMLKLVKNKQICYAINKERCLAAILVLALANS